MGDIGLAAGEKVAEVAWAGGETLLQPRAGSAGRILHGMVELVMTIEGSGGARQVRRRFPVHLPPGAGEAAGPMVLKDVTPQQPGDWGYPLPQGELVHCWLTVAPWTPPAEAGEPPAVETAVEGQEDAGAGAAEAGDDPGGTGDGLAESKKSRGNGGAGRVAAGSN